MNGWWGSLNPALVCVTVTCPSGLTEIAWRRMKKTVIDIAVVDNYGGYCNVNSCDLLRRCSLLQSPPVQYPPLLSTPALLLPAWWMANKVDYLIYYADTSVQSIIYLWQTWSLFSFWLYLCLHIAVFLCCYRFSVNKDLYVVHSCNFSVTLPSVCPVDRQQQRRAAGLLLRTSYRSTYTALFHYLTW